MTVPEMSLGLKRLQMKTSLFLLSLSSLLAAISALGGIGAVSALRNSVVDAHHQLEASMPLDAPLQHKTPAVEYIQVDDSMVLYGSLAMLFWCVVGALIGAWTYVFIIPDEKTNPRRMAAKLVSAAGCGVTLTPLVIHYGGLPRDPNLIGGIATVVALCSIGLIVDLLPSALKRIRDRILNSIPGEDE